MYHPHRITYDDDTMYMIWHNHEFIQIHIGMMCRDFLPALHSNFTNGGKVHFTTHNLTEIRFPIFRTDGDKIIPRVSIIPSFEAGGFDAVFVFEEGHGMCF
jgi:hypothetical protein